MRNLPGIDRTGVVVVGREADEGVGGEGKDVLRRRQGGVGDGPDQASGMSACSARPGPAKVSSAEQSRSHARLGHSTKQVMKGSSLDRRIISP
jgi:hypothetical protein